jgi:hypothetical protein
MYHVLTNTEYQHVTLFCSRVLLQILVYCMISFFVQPLIKNIFFHLLFYTLKTSWSNDFSDTVAQLYMDIPMFKKNLAIEI